LSRDPKSLEQPRKPANRSSSPKLETLGLILVALSMLILFLRPASTYFLIGVFVATPLMMLVTFWLTKYEGLFRPTPRSLATGLISAALLYMIFYGGNYFISTFHPLGIQASSEASIYSTIGTHPLYLQILILLFDGFGFESYFRGTLQNFFSRKLTNPRSKLGAVFLAALCDSLIHVVSLNPLWVVTTFLADSVWGLTYRFTKDLSSSISSHIIWDIAIFIVAPIK
jgi:membrane protease YdiL (CAAX protease family)